MDPTSGTSHFPPPFRVTDYPQPSPSTSSPAPTASTSRAAASSPSPRKKRRVSSSPATAPLASIDAGLLSSRLSSTLRLKQAWADISHRHESAPASSQFAMGRTRALREEDDDVIDLGTMEIIQDRGVLRRAKRGAWGIGSGDEDDELGDWETLVARPSVSYRERRLKDGEERDVLESFLREEERLRGETEGPEGDAERRKERQKTEILDAADEVDDDAQDELEIVPAESPKKVEVVETPTTKKGGGGKGKKVSWSNKGDESTTKSIRVRLESVDLVAESEDESPTRGKGKVTASSKQSITVATTSAPTKPSKPPPPQRPRSTFTLVIPSRAPSVSPPKGKSSSSPKSSPTTNAAKPKSPTSKPPPTSSPLKPKPQAVPQPPSVSFSKPTTIPPKSPSKRRRLSPSPTLSVSDYEPSDTEWEAQRLAGFVPLPPAPDGGFGGLRTPPDSRENIQLGAGVEGRKGKEVEVGDTRVLRLDSVAPDGGVGTSGGRRFSSLAPRGTSVSPKKVETAVKTGEMVTVARDEADLDRVEETDEEVDPSEDATPKARRLQDRVSTEWGTVVNLAPTSSRETLVRSELSAALMYHLVAAGLQSTHFARMRNSVAFDALYSPNGSAGAASGDEDLARKILMRHAMACGVVASQHSAITGSNSLLPRQALLNTFPRRCSIITQLNSSTLELGSSSIRPKLIQTRLALFLTQGMFLRQEVLQMGKTLLEDEVNLSVEQVEEVRGLHAELSKQELRQCKQYKPSSVIAPLPAGKMPLTPSDFSLIFHGGSTHHIHAIMTCLNPLFMSQMTILCQTLSARPRQLHLMSDRLMRSLDWINDGMADIVYGYQAALTAGLCHPSAKQNVSYIMRLVAAYEMKYFPLVEAFRRQAFQEGMPGLAKRADEIEVELMRRLMYWGNKLGLIEGGPMVFDLLSTKYASLPVVLDTILPSPLAECHL
ncbi:hypothetical protein MNV49_002194 [Pseudohyphozyma bogoriensis]|nr:hypothetical protein MNV49_002194 [Pseudohyphozyma bogoriensis]